MEGLARLGGIADGLLLRQGGCAGCTLSGSCGTTASCRLWEQIAHDDPQLWKLRLHAAAQAWVDPRMTAASTA